MHQQTPVVGLGWSSCHHGEILQGLFRGCDGEVHRGLVTLPMRELGAHARFSPEPGTAADDVRVHPVNRTKALRAAEMTLDLCASTRRVCGGTLEVTGEVPVGWGMGSSTSDIIASIRAVASSFGIDLPPATVARLAVVAEGASDPLMLDERPVLFAQRQGSVLEILGPRLPAMVVVGCRTGDGAGVDTLAMPAPEPGSVARYERLRAKLRLAIATSDVALLGAVSTESARYNQNLLFKEELQTLEDIAASVSAAGVQVAHSGSVASILFDAAEPDVADRVRHCVAALRDNGISVTRAFRTEAARTESVHIVPRNYSGTDTTTRTACMPQGGRTCTTTSPTRLANRHSCSCRKDWSASDSRP